MNMITILITYGHYKDNPLKSKRNISPAFPAVGKLGVFAGLCAGLSGPVIAATTPATSDTTAAATNRNITAKKSEPTLVVSAALPSLYLPKSLSDPKFTRPLADTTRTVTVIPEKVIQEQHATTLTDALKNVAGAGAFFAGENGSTSTGDAIYMRGIDTSNSIYVDGIRDISSTTRDTFNTQSVEVIKGPSGSDYGRSAPSGSINTISKQPTLDTSLDGSVSYGSGSERRATLDYNQMISDNSAFRVNMMGDKGNDRTRNNINHEKYGIAPSLAFGLDTPTRLYLNYFHLHQRGTPDGGVPTIGLPGYTAPTGFEALNSRGKVNPHNYYGTHSDFSNATTDTATLRFEHDLTDSTTIRNTTRWSETKQKYLLSAFMGVTASTSDNPDDWTLSRLINTKDVVNKILTNQTNLTSKFYTGSVGHDISTGVEFTRETQTTYGLNALTAPAVNIYSPDSNVSIGGLSPNGANANGSTNTFGIYAFDTLQITSDFELNGGIRLDSYHTEYDSSTACGGTGRGAITCPAGDLKGTPVTTVDTTKHGNLFNWKAGALYHLTRQGNVYVNYGVSQQPPGGSNFQLADGGTGNSANRTDFQPQKAQTAELGTKWSLLNDTLLLSGALFRTDIKNEVSQDASTLEYVQTGRKRVQGYELTASGDITRDWHVMLGYTLQNAKVEEGAAVSNDGSSALSYTPKHAFTSWTTYQITNDLIAGAGARYVGSMHRGTDGAVGTPNKVDSYWVADAMAGYKVNNNLDLQLNVYNVFNKHYVSSINKSGYRYFPGAERSWMLTANVHF